MLEQLVSEIETARGAKASHLANQIGYLFGVSGNVDEAVERKIMYLRQFKAPEIGKSYSKGYESGAYVAALMAISVVETSPCRRIEFSLPENPVLGRQTVDALALSHFADWGGSLVAHDATGNTYVIDGDKPAAIVLSLWHQRSKH